MNGADDLHDTLAKMAAEDAADLHHVVKRLVDLPVSRATLTRVALALGREVVELWSELRGDDDQAAQLLADAEHAAATADVRALDDVASRAEALPMRVHYEAWADFTAKQRCIFAASALAAISRSLRGPRLDASLLARKDDAWARLADLTRAHIDATSDHREEAGVARLRASDEAKRVDEEVEATCERALERAALGTASAFCFFADAGIDDPRWLDGNRRLARIVVTAARG